jgi:putative DNA modification/repair radical SAM protein
MAVPGTQEKLAILADAAKYDASCASSGAAKRDSRGGKGVGSTEGAGICHAYTPDGRCVSLLKILLTNYCMFDCAYCVNRISSNVRRARFSVDEVVKLTLDFYKRNYIEGLFLSSGIIRSPNHTMEELVRVARSLREDHDFRGYIHLKTIPDADPALIEQAGLYADRLSINIELASDTSLNRLAPEKNVGEIRKAMGRLRLRIEDGHDARKSSRHAPRFAPSGQSTQMIVGADASPDVEILRSSVNLYANYNLKRVYYSAFSPIPDASAILPLSAPPLIREHRLYQADWLFRYYGFSVDEIASAAPGGMFDPALDPKLAWALANRALFPVDVNTAPREMLLRVPGFGTKVVARILAGRRFQRLTLDDLKRLRASIGKACPFIEAAGWTPGAKLDSTHLAARMARPAQQLDLFAAAPVASPVTARLVLQ